MRHSVLHFLGTGVLTAFLADASPASAVDTIFLGGDILTMDDARPRAEALAVDDGRIVAIGGEEEIRALGRWTTEVVDLGGATLMPGLIEAHCHPIATASLGQALDVSGFNHRSRASVIAKLREAVAKASAADWVLAFGWDPVMVEDLDNPTLAELDDIAPDVPLFILTQMMHHAYVNSAGYRAAGITRETPDPPGGGAFLKDERGELNGIVYEVSALQRVLQAMPRPPEGAVELLLNLQYARYAKAGFTAIGVLGPVETAGYPLDFMADLSANPNAPVRTFVYAAPDQIDRSGWPPAHGHDRFRIKGVKLYMDGSPYTGGAAFAEPYLNTPLTIGRMGLERDHRGDVNHSQEELVDLITRYHTRGHQIAVHAQGEVALARVLDSFEEVLRAHPRADHRHRLEHAALITKEQLARATALGLTPSFFIDHVYFYGRGLEQIVGHERAARFMPIASAIRAGHRPTIHTDNPATPIGPFRAARTAVTRRMRDESGVLGADERISIEHALKALTINAAWQMFEEEERGSLAVGKVADLVLLSHNPLMVEPDRLVEIAVLGTWIDGEAVDTSPWTWTNLTLGVRLAWGLVKAKAGNWLYP
jgi:predicted amidohydrolase YtcJ